MQPILRTVVVALASAVFPSLAAGQSVAVSSSYSESFDTLSTNNAVSPWQNGDQGTPTLDGWYAEMESVALGSFDLSLGPATAGSLYNFGSNNDADRALGSQASGGTGAVAWGVRIVNTSGGTASGTAVSFTGEQWRTVAGGVQNTQQMYYRLGGTSFDLQSNTGDWTALSSGDFSALHFTASESLDGNLPANRTAVATAISVSLASGQELWIGWLDANEVGGDQALGIDDLTITLQVGTPDAGVTDAGGIDPGAPDGGALPDAGGADAGAIIDAASPDAGSATTPDSGAPDDDGDDEGGCGCQTRGGSGQWPLPLLILAAYIATRRRRNRAR